MARRGLRVSDLFDADTFAERLRSSFEFHNFMLQHYFRQDTIDPEPVIAEWLQMAERVRPLVADTAGHLAAMHAAGENLLFEGAQGTLLDIDHGTYPYVTSSNTTAGAAATGSGIGPADIDAVLGIVKAYTTRVGSGPFPTELFDDMGKHLASVGAEFGATTGRPRRCGWFDAVITRRAVLNSGITALCVTKLDVLDGLDTVKICIGYRLDGELTDVPPLRVDRYVECEPVYEEMPGWQQSTVGVTRHEDLPAEAKAYLERIQSVLQVPVDLISTGPDRDQNVILKHPFD